MKHTCQPSLHVVTSLSQSAPWSVNMWCIVRPRTPTPPHKDLQCMHMLHTLVVDGTTFFTQKLYFFLLNLLSSRVSDITAKQSVWSFRAKDMNSYLQMHAWSPSKLLVDKCIVRAAATHNLRTWNMVNRQSFVLKAEHYLCHLVHAYRLLELQHKDYWLLDLHI